MGCWTAHFIWPDQGRSGNGRLSAFVVAPGVSRAAILAGLRSRIDPVSSPSLAMWWTPCHETPPANCRTTNWKPLRTMSGIQACSLKDNVCDMRCGDSSARTIQPWRDISPATLSFRGSSSSMSSYGRRKHGSIGKRSNLGNIGKIHATASPDEPFTFHWNGCRRTGVLCGPAEHRSVL